MRVKNTPIAKWLLSLVPQDDLVKLQNALIAAPYHYEFKLGQYVARLVVINGELRGSLKPQGAFHPHLDEAGLWVRLPMATLLALKAKDNLQLNDLIEIDGIPHLPILSIELPRQGDDILLFVIKK